MAKFTWADKEYESTLQAIEERARKVIEDAKRPTYKLVPELNGIEIYFTEKPSPEVIEKLKANHWRWQSIKKCWYNKKSAESLRFATELCKANAGEKTDAIAKSPPPSPAIPPTQAVSYSMWTGNQMIGTFSISKTNQGYSVSSTNNLMNCCDCNYYISIHAHACPHCGCPIDYIVDFFYKKAIKETQQQERAEAEQRRREEEQRRQIEEERRRREYERQLEEEKRRQERLEQKQKELEQKRKEEERIQARAAEVREICKKLSLSDSIITQLAKTSVDDQTLRVRVDRIRYYQKNYPELNLQAAQFITNDNIGQYVSRHAANKTDEQVKCIGNCSSCRRETCVLISQR